jgi:Rifampin ADP-ribosyl transferase
MPSTDNPATQQFYHGTRADLNPGDLIEAGYNSNFGRGKPLSWVYLTGALDAVIWGAELAAGDGRERIYIVEPTGPIVDDPNLTDKKFPGNPTQSYRSREPLRVMGEVTEWQGHSPERLKEMRDHLERLKAQGIEAID